MVRGPRLLRQEEPQPLADAAASFAEILFQGREICCEPRVTQEFRHPLLLGGADVTRREKEIEKEEKGRRRRLYGRLCTPRLFPSKRPPVRRRSCRRSVVYLSSAAVRPSRRVPFFSAAFPRCSCGPISLFFLVVFVFEFASQLGGPDEVLVSSVLAYGGRLCCLNCRHFSP